MQTNSNRVGFALPALLLVAISGGTVVTVHAQEIPAWSMKIPSEYLRSVAPPSWSHGFLVLRHIEPTYSESQVVVMRTNGEVHSNIRISIPDISEIHVYDAAVVDQTGAIVLSAALVGGGQRAFALCFVDGHGKLTKMVRTSPFSATFLQVVADGSIWAFGANGEGMADPGLELFRRFSSGGIEQGRYLPLSTFQTVHPGFHPTIITPLGRPSFVSSADRIAAYLPETQEWIEFTVDGNLSSRINVMAPTTRSGNPLRAGTVVMTGHDAVFGWFSGEDSSGLYELHRSTGRWAAVSSDQIVSGEGKGLFGVSGDRLVQGQPNSSDLVLTTSRISPRYGAEIVTPDSKMASQAR